MHFQFIFLLSLIMVFLQLPAQLDTRKLDSLSRAIDSSSKATRSSIDSMSRTLDSMIRAGVKTKTVQPSSPLKEERKPSKVTWIVLTIAGVALLGALMFYLYGKDRKVS